ncbi:hypothetical protein [Streptomyces sp. bgisy027]|uniref:hypothetical protein n=1 Tax=Streptomyces sp. bgisy027 TaxID=3413770 RepID=UPI003D7297AC
MRRPELPVPIGSPLQILLLACSFALAGYAGVRLLDGDRFEIALWFAGAAIIHDIVLVPLYGAADQALLRTFEAADRRARISYVRVPAVLSLLLLLVWFPLITGRVTHRYTGATGHPPADFATRWLLLTAALFAASATVYAIGRWRSGSGRRERSTDTPATCDAPDAESA